MGHIWLVGMMGSGKTTVAAIVAEHLGLPAADTDALVMQAEGRTIPELFEESEQAFREAERRVIASFVDVGDSVVAAGGGAVIDERNASVMASTGTVFLLEAGIETLMGRLGEGDDSRPLHGGRAALERLSGDRASRYAAAADHVIHTDDLTPEDVAREVIQCVNM